MRSALNFKKVCLIRPHICYLWSNPPNLIWCFNNLSSNVSIQILVFSLYFVTCSSNVLLLFLFKWWTLLAVVGDSKGTKTSTDPISERAQSDQLVDGMDFGELCNDFECISSPLVESTARQLVRDILEMREQNRSFGCFSVSIKYKVYT